MDLLQVIIKPYLTEKTFSVREKSSKEVIAFVVHPKANKNDIKQAFSIIYQVTPESVNTITKTPVWTKTGTRNPGMTKLTKIAYVTLPEGVKLAVTKEEIETAKEEIKKENKTETKKVVKLEPNEAEVVVEEKAPVKAKKANSSTKTTKAKPKTTEKVKEEK